MTTTIEIEKLLNWGVPVEVETRNGPRTLRKAEPSPEFWDAWRAGKEQLKAAGISCGKDQRTGNWEVCWWAAIDPSKQAAIDAAIQASKATDADVDLPCPAGRAYMPFQRAGIKFVLDKFGIELKRKGQDA
jgi:hypothetical protein